MPDLPSVPPGPLDSEVVERLFTEYEGAPAVVAGAVLDLNDAIAQQGAKVDEALTLIADWLLDERSQPDQQRRRDRHTAAALRALRSSPPPTEAPAEEVDGCICEPGTKVPDPCCLRHGYGGDLMASPTSAEEVECEARFASHEDGSEGWTCELSAGHVGPHAAPSVGRSAPPTSPEEDRGDELVDRLQDAEGVLRERLAEALGRERRLREGVADLIEFFRIQPARRPDWRDDPWGALEDCWEVGNRVPFVDEVPASVRALLAAPAAPSEPCSECGGKRWVGAEGVPPMGLPADWDRRPCPSCTPTEPERGER